MADAAQSEVPVARVVASIEPRPAVVVPKPVPRTSGLAIASLTLAIIASVLCVCHPFAGIMPALPAVVCGHLGRRDCQRDVLMDGGGYALAGLMLGYVCVAAALLTAIGYVLSIVSITMGVGRLH